MLEAAQLIRNLKSFSVKSALPLDTTWPAYRRSAVLILLFIGRYGELRVILTKRCRNLRSFSGHVSLPGGKSDSLLETPEVVARRESEEEIGLPRDDEILRRDYGMKIETLTTHVPHFLSRTFLSVKPIVSFLHNSETSLENRYKIPLDGSKFFGKLNPGETTSIFSIPLSDLIAHRYNWTNYHPEYVSRKEYWAKWGGLKWFIQHYYYPNENVKDTRWLNDIIDTSSGDEALEGVPCKDVWGLTAKMLQEVCDIAFSELNFGKTIGHESLIYALHELGGQLHGHERSEWESNMIMNKRGVNYKDVIPKFYLDSLSNTQPDF
ncbi:LANO_0H05688g1_1 [Lachancea nothofagi CBS 11611]|uniref:LANO_0H05688g1_1 n=1 Tax=Lachancea nothofagi CBS 11611 TaxID=1266666 RepID=A0A1G4KLI4_9SACH|nr:LANO_0H05688g1_1 [Lachancea nothofagi CBS 11611]